MNEKTVEQHVDSVRAAAKRVEKAREEKGTDAEEKSLELANIQDKWERTKAVMKMYENTAEIEQEAIEAMAEVRKGRIAVMTATHAYPRNNLYVVAHQTVEEAYSKAHADLSAVLQLVDRVEQTCKEVLQRAARDQ